MDEMDLELFYDHDSQRPTITNSQRIREVARIYLQTIVSKAKEIQQQLQYCVRKNVNANSNPQRHAILKSSLLIYLSFFLMSIVVNSTTFSGACIGKLDERVSPWINPFHKPLGYNGCERDLDNDLKEENVRLDEDYTVGIKPQVRYENASKYFTGNIDARTLHILGSMDTNFVRIYGEWFRFFTAGILHGSWTHLLTNCLVHSIVLYIIEPDWGFYRTIVAYAVTGIGGFLVGSVLVPCLQQVGSSGVQMGFLGCILVYCVEHWNQMGSPSTVLLLSIVVFFLDIVTVERNISDHIHIGGYLFGLLYGLSTIKSVALFDSGAIGQRLKIWAFSKFLSDEVKHRCNSKITAAKLAEDAEQSLYEAKAREVANRNKLVKCVFGLYPHGPYRMRLRDIMTRTVSFFILVIMILVLLLGLCNEAFYSALGPSMAPLFSSRCICCSLKKNTVNNALVGRLEGMYYCFSSPKHVDFYC